MLAYSGKGRFVVMEVNLSDVVQEMTHLLGVSISKSVAIRYDFAHTLPAIEADVTQLRQIVMNLIMNASDAIGPDNGVVSVCTGAAHYERSQLAKTYLNEDLPAGEYVYLEVADTGCGMDRETCDRIFDPFFTTKFTGRGLGLAAVLGIVRGHKGAISVESEPGKGTTVRVLFPALGHIKEAVLGDDAEPVSWRGSGTLLVADDEDVVRRIAERMLRRKGFDVLAARDGQEAVDLFRQHADAVRLVLLDMTMPLQSGEETLAEMRRIREDVPVILSSGYSEQEAVERFEDKGLDGFLQKPYKTEALLEKVRAILGL